MPELQHLSYSSISTYQLCPEAWRRRYVAGEKEPVSIALVFGTAVHNTIEAFMRGDGDPLVVWEQKLTSQIVQEENIAWETDTPESLTEDGKNIFRAPAVFGLLNDLKAQYTPGENTIERKVTLHVPGVPVPIIGYIDIITTDGVPWDFKTAARMWAPDKAQSEMQPLVYLAALNQDGHNTHGWKFRHFVITKTSRPTAKVFECQRSPIEVLTTLFPTIQQAWIDIQSDRFPKITNTWKCSPKYCGYYANCQGKGQ